MNKYNIGDKVFLIDRDHYGKIYHDKCPYCGENCGHWHNVPYSNLIGTPLYVQGIYFHRNGVEYDLTEQELDTLYDETVDYYNKSELDLFKTKEGAEVECDRRNNK